MLFLQYKKQLFDPNYSDQLELIFTYAFFIFFFYMAVSISNNKPNWNILFYNVVPIGLAFYVFISKRIRKVLFITSFIYAVLGILIGLFVTNVLTTKKLKVYNSNYNEFLLVRELQPYINKTNYIVCDDYRLDSILAAYLHRQPDIFSDSWAGHEYKFWGKKLNRMIKDHAILHFIYLSKAVKPRFQGYIFRNKYSAHFKLTNAVIFGSPKWRFTVYQCVLIKQQENSL